jgi:hypothetical protein
MFPQLKVRSFNKNVPVWSGRKQRQVFVEVDYQSIRAGDFTLIHIARMRDSNGNDTEPKLSDARFLK